MTLPSWLPSPLVLNPIPHDIYDILHRVFEKDFIANRIQHQGMPVWWNRRICDGYQECFWHLISHDDCVVRQRILDTRRAEKLPWCSPSILNHDQQELSTFDYLEGGGRIRTYHIDGESTRKKLRKKKENCQ